MPRAALELACADCGRRTPIGQEGAWYDPGGPFAESDEYCPPSVVCATCAVDRVAFADDHVEKFEAEMLEEARRRDEWDRIAAWADKMGI